MLEVKQVSKWFSQQRGVSEIDFAMNRGEIVGFLGPNGAGKTTTMRMITGYLNPTSGSILVDGLSMAEHPKKARRQIGYLPETPPLYPEMTIASYLKFVADLREIPRREQKSRIGEVIEKLGLQGREKQIIRSLSKGYKQRVGLAQAILHKPDLLILDEPTSGLDPNQIIEIRQLIRELGENHTVLLSTHILPEVHAICTRVLIINKGRIVLDNKPEQIAQSMGQAFEVKLEVRGPLETVKEQLEQLDTVESVQVIEAAAEESEENSTRLLVVSRDRQDIREALFFRMAELGYPIIGMERERMSLEDIFVKLTTEETEGIANSDGSGESDDSEGSDDSPVESSGKQDEPVKAEEDGEVTRHG
ncbi:ABC transporter ATP-binding protein [Paenibacillus sp. J2TS4]|uniref:ABC transporter ATP-binding protein n=1 Tax=Paenibacillus sp. J2TS4 TaxID=2807194 RepID=UPI001B266F9C|nr:ATP-binding cassette domain-containing protein [Paenibacillus sp. J2TS4]GIP35650.1 ABC transporter ATP-binding protein [Paenibacillus sp. J2TS4]